MTSSEAEQPKLFRLPGTIEEEEELHQQQQQHHASRSSRPESPLLATRNNNVGILPRNVTLLRVSTHSSSIAGITRQDSSRSRYRAGPIRKLRRRAVLKNGECNVLQSRISRRSLRFLQDIFTTLVDTQWRWTLLCFALSFVLSWLVFAGIWYLIAFTHGDFDPSHYQNDDWRPCVSDLHSFTSCFLFSIETQHTIGYGGRATTEECPEAIFVMCIQSISGVMIQALMVGVVFAKMSRPKQRTQTLLFSKQAVICQRDGELCLMFRVGDMRKSHIIGATVRAQLIRSRTTKEGEILPHNQIELVVGADGQAENLFFIWPCTVVHRINSESPFYNMSAEDMLTERFELVVILEGTIESTGQTTQARSSYLPQEVLWGHRFEPMVSYSKERQGYEVDYSRFNSTVQVDTPLCSGRELAEFYRLQDGLKQPNSSGFVIEEEIVPAPMNQSRVAPSAMPCRQCILTQHQQLSLEDEILSANSRNSKCYSSDCVGPPPYGRSPVPAKDNSISIDEEVAALLLETNYAKRLLQGRYPGVLATRSLNGSRKTLCCREDAGARSLNASKKLLASDQHLERLNSRSSLRRSMLAQQRKEELQEILVHKLQGEDKKPETSQAAKNPHVRKVNGRSHGSSERSYETNSSSESEQLIKQPVNFTSV